jgi:hypothetical protein
VSGETGTPIRLALADGSFLVAQVQDGLGAMEAKDRGFIDERVRAAFADSLYLDKAMEDEFPRENKWDYLLGHAGSRKMVGLEPHSAKSDQISTVIAKKKAAQAQLRPHLRQGARVDRWLWVASGKVHFANTEKARFRLDQNGITFVGTKVLAKHLPSDA